MTNPPAEPWTTLSLLNWTKEHFERHEVDSPRLSAEILLAHSLRCLRIDLYTRFDYRPTPEELADFRRNVRRASRQEPVAYLVGEKEFYSLRFKVTPDVLVPRPETELLAQAAIGHLRGLGRPGAAWDVCTGSGCVAIALAVRVPDATVLATDISPEALAVAEENARLHHVQERVTFRVADLLARPEDRDAAQRFDVIAANPPYVGEKDWVSPGAKHEPRRALYAGTDGLDCIRRIVAAAPDALAAGGLLAIEFGYRQADAVRDLVVLTGRFDEPLILRDHQGIERTALAKKRL